MHFLYFLLLHQRLRCIPQFPVAVLFFGGDGVMSPNKALLPEEEERDDEASRENKLNMSFLVIDVS